MNREPSQHDQDLWQQFVQANGSTPQQREIDPNSLASYLDGTADDSVVEAIEQTMAANPKVLECVIEMRQIQDTVNNSAGHVVPNAVTTAAIGLVKHAREPQTHNTLRPPAWTWWRGLQQIAASAVVAITGIAGYAAGTDTYHDEVLADRAMTDTIAGLSDFEDESPLLLAVIGNGGAL